MSNLISKEELLGQEDTIIEKVELPTPYKGHMFVKSMTGDEWDAYQDLILVADEDGRRKVDLKRARAKILVYSICDEAGNLLFEKSDYPILAKKSNKLLEKLAKVAQQLNGMAEDTPEKN